MPFIKIESTNKNSTTEYCRTQQNKSKLYYKRPTKDSRPNIKAKTVSMSLTIRLVCHYRFFNLAPKRTKETFFMSLC